MDFQVQISETALADLEQITEYSWANFPAAAERFINAILNHLELLRDFPYIGSPVSGEAGVRQLVHTPILIYYPVDKRRRTVEIVHFWHASRRPPAVEPRP